MEITCKHCGAAFRLALKAPLTHAIRAICPACGKQVVVKPSGSNQKTVAPADASRRAVIADEPRAFRHFLAEQLGRMGFAVEHFETGDKALARVRDAGADLVILNVYLRGKLGVEICEEIRNEARLAGTKVVLIGALFRANRFRANPTNLYGADEYIEEQIPAAELHRMVRKLFPDVGEPQYQAAHDEFEDARRLARLILSDIVIYHSDKVEQGIRQGDFFERLRHEIDEGRAYYESKIPFRVLQESEFFTETLQHFLEMKREELQRAEGGARR
jgi:DNA-binding response OmpR family regulator/DNA-directed RNA polymerase subunit RPC12/RpoP